MGDTKDGVTTPPLQGRGPVLVTGGGGFLGGAITRLAAASDREVRTLSRGTYPHLERLGVGQIQGNLADYETVLGACRGCRLVFHVAAKAGIWGDPDAFYQANVVGTKNVLRACLESGVERLVYTSSPSVVFDGRDMEGADESVPYATRFMAPYPRTKAHAEQDVLHHNGSRLATVALRPHLIWGPGDPHILPGLMHRARAGQLRRIGRLQKRVDFTYIDNAAHAHILAALRLAPGSPIAGKAYFITDDLPEPLWQFVNRLLQAGGVDPVRKSVPRGVAYSAAWLAETLHRLLGRSGEPRLTRFLVEELATAHWFDIGAAKRDLGYAPVITREQGLARVREWLQAESASRPS